MTLSFEKPNSTFTNRRRLHSRSFPYPVLPSSLDKTGRIIIIPKSSDIKSSKFIAPSTIPIVLL